MKKFIKTEIEIPVEKLQDLASELEYRIDRVMASLDGRKYPLEAARRTREGIMNYIALIANVEEDLQGWMKQLVAEYMEKIYALDARLEKELELLEGQENYFPEEDRSF